MAWRTLLTLAVVLYLASHTGKDTQLKLCPGILPGKRPVMNVSEGAGGWCKHATVWWVMHGRPPKVTEVNANLIL